MFPQKHIRLHGWIRVITVMLLLGLLLPAGSVTAQDGGPLRRQVPAGGVPTKQAGAAESVGELVAGDIIQDGSFESSYGYTGYWNQYSYLFGTPLCTSGDCGDGAGTAGPRTGSVWGWYGGYELAEEADVWQNVTIPASCTVSLQFYLWIGYAGAYTGADDVFIAYVDGTDVFTTNATRQSSFPSYTLVTVDVSAFADGSSHTVGFYSLTHGTGNYPQDVVSFNLDDVALVVQNCPISGNAGTVGVTLGYNDGGAKTVTSGSDGSYSFRVPYNWSGTVTPSHACYTFNPANRPYTNVTSGFSNQNYTATVNPSAGCTNVNVNIGGASRGDYAVPPQGSARLSYASLDNGPVKVGTGSGSIIASERINLKANTAYNSYGEVMGLPASKLSDSYIFPWYNNTGFLDSQLRFANVGNAATTVTVKIGGVAQPTTYPLDPNQSVRVSFPGVDNGPVEVTSSNGVPIIAAMRINLKAGSPFTSYSEFLGLSASSTVSTRYMFPWYNNTGLLDSQLRFANIGTTPTTVTLKIGGVVQGSYPLNASQSTRISLPNVDKGPVEVTSSGNVPITAAMRINLKNNTAFTSYTELMGLTGASLTDTRYLFPWYNNTGLLDSQLRFGNVGSVNTTVSIKINGVVQAQTYTLRPNESVRVSLAGVDNGPVEVYSSGEPIIAALRINIKNNASYDSYYEFMGMSVGSPLGLPGNQLSSTYWFPWYNNTGLLDSQLRFGVP